MDKLESIIIKLLNILCHVMVFMFLFSISQIILSMRYFYLLEWTVRNLYCYVWILPLVLTLLGKYIGAWLITVGNAISVVVGQILGDYFYQIDFFGDSMNGYHHGFQIWANGLIFSVILAVAVELLLYFRKKRRAKT